MIDCIDRPVIPHIVGLPLDRALDLLARLDFPSPLIQRTAPPEYFRRKDPHPRPHERVARARYHENQLELCVVALRDYSI